MAFMDETTELEVEKNKAIRGYIVRALARGNNGALLVRQIVNALMSSPLILWSTLFMLRIKSSRKV